MEAGAEWDVATTWGGNSTAPPPLYLIQELATESLDALVHHSDERFFIIDALV